MTINYAKSKTLKNTKDSTFISITHLEKMLH